MTRERAAYQTAAELRSGFDAAFASAPAAARSAELDLLVIQIAGHQYGLRLADVLAVHVDRKLVMAPSLRSDLLGLVGLRGAVVPVYDLAALLGYRPGPAPRWLAQVRAAAPFALAFEQFERHVRVPLGSLRTPERGSGPAHALVSGAADTSVGSLAVVDLQAVFAEVMGARRPAAQQGKHTS